MPPLFQTVQREFRTVRVIVRFTLEERRKLGAMARHGRCNMSEVIRRALDVLAERQKPVDEAAD